MIKFLQKRLFRVANQIAPLNASGTQALDKQSIKLARQNDFEVPTIPPSSLGLTHEKPPQNFDLQHWIA
jgi:hypothetical protein